jgi:hypothetical protein
LGFGGLGDLEIFERAKDLNYPMSDEQWAEFMRNNLLLV